MRLSMAILVVIATAVAQGAFAAPLGEAGDLPAAGIWPVELKGLPKMAALGESPAKLLGGQAVYSAAKGSADVKKLRAPIDEVFGSKLEKRNFNYQWYSAHLMGFDVGAFDLEGGRIFRIGYFSKRLAQQRGESAIKEFARLDPKAELWPKPDPNAEPKAKPPAPNRAMITVEGVRLVCAVQRPPGLAGEEPNSPGMIVYSVHPTDWYLLNHKPEEGVAEAIKNGEVQLGMSEEEAIAAMPFCKVVREASANERLVWLNFFDELSDASSPKARVYLNDYKVKDVQQKKNR